MCCGGGGGSTTVQQDPQVGQAALENAQTAREELQFTKDYLNNTLSPIQQREDQRAQIAADQATQEYNDNRARAVLQDQRYRQYGIPAEDAYYSMVKNYSSDAEQERQANLAQGDVTTAAQVQSANVMRQMQSLGIDPTSPAALAAMSDASVTNTATAAAAANQARSAAKTLGMQLTSDAANFGRGTTSNIAAFSNMAASNSAQAQNAGQQSLNNALNTGGFVQGGYKAANSAFGQNLQSLVADSSSRNQLSAQQSMANAQGMGSGIGSLIGAAGAAAAIF